MFQRLKSLWQLSDQRFAKEEQIVALFDKLSDIETKTDKIMGWMGILLRDAIERREKENNAPQRRTLR